MLLRPPACLSKTLFGLQDFLLGGYGVAPTIRFSWGDGAYIVSLIGLKRGGKTPRGAAKPWRLPFDFGGWCDYDELPASGVFIIVM